MAADRRRSAPRGARHPGPRGSPHATRARTLSATWRRARERPRDPARATGGYPSAPIPSRKGRSPHGLCPPISGGANALGSARVPDSPFPAAHRLRSGGFSLVVSGRLCARPSMGLLDGSQAAFDRAFTRGPETSPKAPGRWLFRRQAPRLGCSHLRSRCSAAVRPHPSFTRSAAGAPASPGERRGLARAPARAASSVKDAGRTGFRPPGGNSA